MRLSHHRSSRPASMNMTPMIDVVFQLLIFFLTVSQVSRVNTEVLELPRLPGAEDQQTTSLTVNLNAAGELIVLGEKQSMSAVLEIARERIGSVGGEASLMTTTLRVDRRSSSRPVNELVTALRGLGITRVRIGVESPQ
ncbi:MAG: biopolymer transporter ExbD [Planctomycetes bacterium]|nr:biopolymer transporter ExbD [Planctomycetota bacterium]